MARVRYRRLSEALDFANRACNAYTAIVNARRNRWAAGEIRTSDYFDWRAGIDRALTVRLENIESEFGIPPLFDVKAQTAG